MRLNCNTNCPHTWWFSHSDTEPRRQIFSDFFNPPYFYLMVGPGVTLQEAFIPPPLITVLLLTLRMRG